MNCKTKLENLMILAKPYAMPDRFFLLEDSDGWTDGYIADLTNLNTATMQARAVIKGIIQDQKPKIKPLIPDGSHVVENIALDLSDNMAILYNRTVAVKVNPCYLKFFDNAYKKMGGIKELIVTAPDKSVKVMTADENELVGLIMPVRTASR